LQTFIWIMEKIKTLSFIEIKTLITVWGMAAFLETLSTFVT